MPHSLMHRIAALVPFWRWLLDGLEFFIADGPALAAAVKRGEHLIVTPGGAREACRRWDDTYRVDWGEHLGYVRLAVKYGMPIVPVGAAGADGTYIGLFDGPALGRRLGIPADYAYLAWVGLGPLGFYPLSPPFPVRFHQIVGEPIDPRAEGVTSPRDRPGLLRVHQRVTAAVQSLIDRARARVRNKEV
jgi:1-acyl-sn-glycerol-3-phosphate acyltransferase